MAPSNKIKKPKQSAIEPIDNFHTQRQYTWCPGCGNHGLITALKYALQELKIPRHQTVIASGIGQNGLSSQMVNTYGFHGLHGRALPIAEAVKIANPNLTVLATVGDGDQYAEGTNHLIHAARRNLNMACIVHDNMVYGLTAGQASPTSEKGYVSKTTPEGKVDEPINPIAIALSAGATFVARGFVAEFDHLVGLFKKAIRHNGFALVDVFQPCVSWNKVNTYDWFRDRVYKINGDGRAKHNPRNKMAAFELAHQWGKKIPIGIFYQVKRPTFIENEKHLIKLPLAGQKIENIDLGPAMEKLVEK